MPVTSYNTFLMKRNLIYILFAAMSCNFIHAQSTELKGTVIGSAKANYASGDASMAFDGNLSTFYASDVRSNTYAGLDLGEKHIITKVGYASRKDWPQRMQLGVFEGANSPDFTDAVPLYMIKETPKDNVMTYADVNVSRGFRYVRYVGPNNVRCNVAELKFYGTKGEGDDTKLYTPTNLPLVVIHTDKAQAITSKEVYVPGIVSVVSEGGAKVYSDSLGIRGRGNASWDFPKKPYKLKLANKKKLLGMPAKAKKWTLINNYGDKTLIRNVLAFHLSECLGMEYTPAARMVDVMVNGEYEGTYQLCDQIEIKKNRVGITEMTPGDNAVPAITGGYLVEIDAYAGQEKSTFTTSTYQLPVTIKSPGDDEITTQQYNYVKNAFSVMTARVASSTPSIFRKYIDTKSFMKHFIVGELSGNTDTYWSVYMYKDRDSTRFYTGPVWDFDLAFENDARTHPISDISGYLYASSKSSVASGGIRSFVSRIITTDKPQLRKIWSKARYDRGLNIDDLNAYLDSLQTLVNESQKLNFIRWPIMNTLVHQNYQITGSYEGEMKTIRDYLEYRIPWLDNMIGLTPVGIESRQIAGGDIRAVDGGIAVGGFGNGAKVNIYDTSGMQVAAQTVAGGAATISLQPGVYVVKITAGSQTLRKKIVVR